MPDVVDVFDHLGGLDRRHDDLFIDGHVDAAHDVGGPLAGGADHGFRRGVEIFDSDAFAQEFGVEADAEVLAQGLAGDPFDDRGHHAHGCARRDGAAHDDHVEAVFLGDAHADRTGGAFDVAVIAAAVSRGRCADRYEGHVGFTHGVGEVVRGRDQPVCDPFRQQPAKILFMDRRDALRDLVDLHLVKINPDHRVPEARQTGRRNSPHIAKANNADRGFV